MTATEKKHDMPPLLAEKLVLNELRDAQKNQVRRRYGEQTLDIASDITPAIREADQAFFADTLRNATILNGIQSALGHDPKSPNVGSQRFLGKWLLGSSSLVVVAAAAIFAIFTILPSLQHQNQSSDEIRLKGAQPRIEVYRKLDQGFEWIASGVAASSGDLLQIRYVAAGRAFGVIFSLDGRGVRTVHLPTTGAAAALLKQSGEIALPHSYELDDAPEFERFFFVTANERFPVALVEQAIVESLEQSLEQGEGLQASLEKVFGDRPFNLVTFNLKKIEVRR